MILTSKSFAHGTPIPTEFAFGQPDGEGAMSFAGNQNPHLSWSDVPPGCQSFAISCIDSEGPTEFDNVNVAGTTIAADMPRQDFTHWLIANLRPSLRELEAGSCSDGVVGGGKFEPLGPEGCVQGANDYGDFMGDGDYLGYDGPCPPWNDERLHQYHFTVYALSVPTLDLAHGFTRAQFDAALAGNVLASATLTGSYAINPSLHGKG